MNIEDLRDYCLSKAGAAEDLPFDQHTLVFKVMGKIFAITSLADEDLSVNLKCEPVRAVELREQYPEVIPGFHMNKKHWNTVDFAGSLPPKLLYGMIDDSYDLVVQGLSGKQREELLQLDQSDS
jgi:predicted DNA-binding protein (MmcQ/YjbR family)